MATRSVRDLLEQPVISPDDVHMGDVADVLIDPAEQRVVTLAVDWLAHPGQISGPSSDLPLSQVANFDPHQLVTGGEVGQTAGLDFDAVDAESLIPATSLLDREVSTRSGDVLGGLADIYFDDSDGAVSGYEVEQEATGLPSRILLPSADMEFGADRVVVPDNFQVATDEEYGLEDEEVAEEQDLVFESGLPDRRTEDPSVEGPDERPERDRIID
ncbi:MAG: PRC-barrel domain-containing protein [Candidatus Sericytochromatia bacterium]|nr:PRC-barrel domain-containing protein [Candidatus Tanganyikabacteria bacterium]